MNRKTLTVYLACIGAVVVLIAVLLLIWFGGSKNEPSPSPLPEMPEQPDRETVYIKPDKITPTKVEIDTTVIRERLEEMGTLITAEYMFTEVIDFTSTKSLFGMNLGFTKTTYVASYDGTVSAGIDFSWVSVFEDEEKKTLTVSIPSSSIQNTSIDYNSFKVYQEKDGLWNPLSVTDVNKSQKELVDNAVAKAQAKGILKKADEKAAQLIIDFLKQLPELAEYRFEIVRR